MVTIESSDVNKLVEGMVTTSQVEYPWIGGYLVSSSNKVFAWIDGSAFAYENWDLTWNNGKDPQPDYNDNEGCVELVNGKWHDFVCSFKRAFICMKLVVYVPVPTPTTSPDPVPALGLLPPGIQLFCFEILYAGKWM